MFLLHSGDFKGYNFILLTVRYLECVNQLTVTTPITVYTFTEYLLQEWAGIRIPGTQLQQHHNMQPGVL